MLPLSPAPSTPARRPDLQGRPPPSCSRRPPSGPRRPLTSSRRQTTSRRSLNLPGPSSLRYTPYQPRPAAHRRVSDSPRRESVDSSMSDYSYGSGRQENEEESDNHGDADEENARRGYHNEAEEDGARRGNHRDAEDEGVRREHNDHEDAADVAARHNFAEGASTAPARARPGRKKGPIWRHYERLGSEAQAHPPVKCLGCGKLIGSGLPKRSMIPHALECTEISPLDKRFLRMEYNIPDGASTAPAEQPAAAAAACAVPQPNPSESATSPSSGPLGQEEFELLLARMWFMCALPFILIEAPAVRMLFLRLVPHLRLPTRARLSGVLLPLIYEEVRAQVIEFIKEKGSVTIVTDMFTDVNKSSVINFMVTAPGMKSLFWSSLVTGTAKHTSRYLARQLERVIEEVQRMTGATVTAVLSDNASNMVGAWKLLESKLPIFGGGCAAHVLNLVMEEVFSKIKFVNDVLKKAYTITKLVREHTGLLEQFRTLQKSIIPRNGVRRALAIPVPTRWYSQHSCLKSVLMNRHVLEDLFCAPRHSELRERFETLEAESIVSSESFWQKLEYAVVLIDPIIQALGVLESDEAEPSRVYEQFRRLLEGYSDQRLNRWSARPNAPPHVPFGEPTTEVNGERRERHNRLFGMTAATRALVRAKFKAVIQARWNYCHTDAMGIAFLLDPSTDTTQFVGEDEENTIEEACNYAERSKLLERLNMTRATFNGHLYDFAAAKKKWTAAKKAKYAGARPSSWWGIRKDYDDMHRALSHLADIVFSVSTSSAASERAWSILDSIHSKKRNCLKEDKVDMLTYTYINGGMIDGDKIDAARVMSYPESDVIDTEILEQQDITQYLDSLPIA